MIKYTYSETEPLENTKYSAIKSTSKSSKALKTIYETTECVYEDKSLLSFI